MLEEIELQKFKQFKGNRIPLSSRGVLLVAGVNNSGKSSILHALAIWEFCRTIIDAEKGAEAFLPGARNQGLGLGDDEFSPILVPSLNHLWTNLKTQKTGVDKDGFTLRIAATWSDDGGAKRTLEFGLALANDRLFVKATNSNLSHDTLIPRLAYLPPFAGITSREMRLPIAIRRRRIGEGLSGAILRNVLLDLHQANHAKRVELRDGKSKISDADLANLRQNDAWEILQQALRDTFSSELIVNPFREEYHSYLKIEVVRGVPGKNRIKRHPGYRARDLMVEGSGFLQWLSVYALATDPSISTLLLDEPDAHLHSSLQRDLFEKLEELAERSNKQILVATHSSEILRNTEPANILEVRQGAAPRFLKNEQQKTGLLAGLGSEYSPRLEKIAKNKRILFLEGSLDERVLKAAARNIGVDWPENWVFWKSASRHKERRQLFDALSEEIDGLIAVSVRDRDDESRSTVGELLRDKSYSEIPNNFYAKKWRRRHIESYVIYPPAMASVSGLAQVEIERALRDEFGLSIGESFPKAEAPDALL